MIRYRAYGPLDDTLEVFGDVQFVRLDMKSDPATLPSGAVQICENMRFDTNGATVRAGIARQFQAGTSLGQIYGAGIYRQVGGVDQFVLVTGSQLVLFTPATQTLQQYALPSGQGFGPGDVVDLVQAGIGAGSFLPMLFILHGLDEPVLLFDGNTVTVAVNVPRALFGLAYQNRLAFASALQALSCSNFLDFLGPTSWNLLNQFQIEFGGTDYLVGAMAWQGDYVLIGSRNKWFVAYFDPTLATTGYTGALQNASFLRLLTNEAGPVGREAMLESAGVIWFISDNGIYAFQPNLNNNLIPLGRPLSVDIKPVYDLLSAAYVGGACIQRYGYRLYFALPISDEPIALVSLTITATVTSGVTLPVTLPFLLSRGALATVAVAAPHNCLPGDVVQLANIVGGGLNGQYAVVDVVDSQTLVVAVAALVPVVLGSQATLQKLATRNNTIAVLNLNNADAAHPLGMWESIDTLPEGFYADWLRIAEVGATRRLWVVDAINGPALYEEGSVDEVGDISGGITLPFTLPVTLTDANFASVPIPGRLVTRSFRWEGMLGAPHGTIAYRRRVRASEARLTVAAGDAGTVTSRMRTPGQAVVETVTAFTGSASQADIAVKQRIYQPGLEVEVEFAASAGRPTVRATEVQVTKTGQY